MLVSETGIVLELKHVAERRQDVDRAELQSPGAYRELEGLEEDLVCQKVDSQLLIAEGVHAGCGSARCCAHLPHSAHFSATTFFTAQFQQAFKRQIRRTICEAAKWISCRCTARSTSNRSPVP